MKYIINPYSQVILNKGKYDFYAPPSKKSTTKIELSITTEMLDLLLSKEGLTKNELINIVGVDETDFLIEHEIYLLSAPEDNEVESRTKQYYKQHLSLEQQKQINNSNVLILGCGGIGSSVAWLIAGLGVKKMTIVDFDTVEISNLNRMFMFDKHDIGEKKVSVVRRKLQNLYDDLEINIIDAMITSETHLSEICLNEKYDLIIKALDSPSAFPIWLDSVCKKNDLCYVGGITLRDRVMIGPTYIPNVAEDGWSDIINIVDSSERIYGKIPSIGVMLFDATDRIAIESIKILSRDYDACEYKRCIFSQNIFTGEQETIRNKKSCFIDNGIRKTTSLLNVLVILGFGFSSLYNVWLLVPMLCLTCVLPFFSYYGKKYILIQTFINSTIGSMFLSGYILSSIGFGFLAFCLVSIVVASIISLMSLFVNSIIIKIFVRK